MIICWHMDISLSFTPLSSSKLHCHLPHSTLPTSSFHLSSSFYPPHHLLHKIGGAECCHGYGDWKDDGKKGGVIWESHEISQAAQGKLIHHANAGSICTDTRLLERGQWFLALSGPRFDAHHFLPQALHKGCAGAVARTVPPNWPAGFVQVHDPMQALLSLAAHVRARYTGPLVAITGSCGKTTTRLMTSLALKSLGPVHQTLGNQNNRYGVPMSLLGMPSRSAACVLELGMSQKGEILELSRVSQPDVRVILNVGPAHMENFGSLDEIAAAKGELFADARPGDVCVVNADDPLVMALRFPPGVHVVRFGSSDSCHMRLRSAEIVRGGLAIFVVLEHWVNEQESQAGITSFSLIADVCRSSITPAPLSCPDDHGKDCSSIGVTSSDMNFNPTSKIDWKCKSRVEFEIPSPGLHLGLNACAAAAVAMSLNVPLRHVAEALSKYSPLSMRSKFEELGSGILLIDDSYNANPMSMKAALHLLQSMQCGGRKIALLGDMLELGELTKQAHLEALMLCQSSRFDLIGLVGPHFLQSAQTDEFLRVHLKSCEILCFLDSALLAAQIVCELRKGDAVLVKGSRSMRMEVVVNAIKEAHEIGR